MNRADVAVWVLTNVMPVTWWACLLNPANFIKAGGDG